MTVEDLRMKRLKKNLDDIKERLTFAKTIELERNWLLFFYQQADFGPADQDVRLSIKQKYIEQGGKLPSSYIEPDTET